VWIEIFCDVQLVDVFFEECILFCYGLVIVLVVGGFQLEGDGYEMFEYYVVDRVFG